MTKNLPVYKRVYFGRKIFLICRLQLSNLEIFTFTETTDLNKAYVFAYIHKIWVGAVDGEVIQCHTLRDLCKVMSWEFEEYDFDDKKFFSL